jgi:predicted NBD/HSP70 family sugar kinase
VYWTAGIDVKPAFTPPLDPSFQPAALINRRFREMVKESGTGVALKLGVERADGSVSTYETVVFGEGNPHFELNLPYVERIVKFLLWQRGGWRVYVGGPAAIGQYVQECYREGGSRAFDAEFMGGVYEHPFTVVICAADAVPGERETSVPLGRHLDGCRVGFDLGGSDRKCAAVKDGEVIFSEEVVWDPYHETDPQYHYDGVVDSIKRAAAHLPRIDAIGGSAAGVYVNNRVRVGSLYRGIRAKDPALFEKKIAGMFIEIGKQFGVPMEVVNDGEVTALAGSMSLGENPVLGVAMGTSVAAGYVNKDGNITGWLNELAFVPVDYRENGPADEWSGDGGCGVQYFCQQGTARIAAQAGMDLGSGKLPTKLVNLQKKMADGDELAAKVYETVGIEFGYAVAHFADFYDMNRLLILGRVTSGKGGDLVIVKAKEVLEKEFPELAAQITMSTPDEKMKRVGQSIAAASLPATA